MEIALVENMHTYSGGLGVLAGDTIKSFADKHIPVIAITLLNEKGYFKQKIDENGNQIESDYEWKKEDFLMQLPNIVEVKIENRTVKVKAWEYRVVGISGFEVPVYFLDTNIDGNSEYDRTLTSHLYGGDHYYRLCQEIVLGIGGLKFIQSRGYNNLQRYHMNEGHAAFLTLELLKQFNGDVSLVRKKCVFTTHTPVAAGHDKFSRDEILKTLGSVPEEYFNNGELSTTELALKLSHYVNGVAKKHQEVSSAMFPNYSIDWITNGVHSLTWTCDSFKKLFDKKIPAWRLDPFAIRYSIQIPLTEIWNAHMEAKIELVKKINEMTKADFDYDTFTIGFARRATGYKRMDLLFYDINRLMTISKRIGKIQLVFAGKAHVHDYQGKELIKKIVELKNKLGENIKIVFLENYDMGLAGLITSGVDLWLNTPKRPLEASGTSGMKACHNGVPSLSTLDGWWVEGHIENFTGWSIGALDISDDDALDANDLYFKLEKIIMPMFYNNKDEYVKIMRYAIAFNASFFNTSRMVAQYVTNAYLA
jgi:starch phosphorylase